MKEIITSEYDGCMLRNYLIGKCKLSHKLITKLKAEECGILLNNVRVTVRAVLHTGDILELNYEDREYSDILPVKTERMPEILYEDSELIILNKPPYMPTHPSHNHYGDTLANALTYIFKERGENLLFRAITRLDRNTSGAVLVAKNARSASLLSSMMQSGKILKTYIAICEGSSPEIFTVNKPIKREAESIITRTVCKEGEGQNAITHFEKLCEYRGNSILSVTPITGRTHQIRVHLSFSGYPIVGDELYGGSTAEIKRQALHASNLTLLFPDGKKLSVSAPPPYDMSVLLPNDSFNKKD